MYETTFAQDKAMADADTSGLRFAQRVGSMVAEADQYVSDLTARKAVLADVVAAIDAQLVQAPSDATLAIQQARASRKLAELDAMLTQAGALKTAINAAVNG